MSKLRRRSTNPVLSACLVLTLLFLASGFSSAATREMATSVISAAKLTASDADGGDYFGQSVSVSGDTAVVGAPESSDTISISGSAYVFERDEGREGNWGQVAKLTASDGAEGDEFGSSVSISGDTIVIGAYWDDDKGEDSGSAYVFERDEGREGNWGQVAKLTASDGAEGDQFGSSVSISGDTIIVGACGAAVSSWRTGSAYLFEKPDAGWTNTTETAKLTASDGAEGDSFGLSVSISDDTVVVGAFRDDDNGYDSGSAYLFEKPAGGWISMSETAKLTPSDGAIQDEFGLSVSISGDNVIVGAFWDDDNGSSSGSAYLFEKPGASWTDMTETGKLTASDGDVGDFFGNSVSISGDTIVVGAPGDDDNGEDSGSAYYFEKPEAGWTDMTEMAKFTAPDGDEGHGFGSRVSSGGGTLVVGAPLDDGNGWYSGSAYVFYSFEPIAWIYLPVVLRDTP